ncbi:Outer membrane protein beta-barrel domain-containing protein [Filimonas lacunae]|uniref:Outer membrane protein beta-barrel domain-containing protein n=2 Tax=Filimonas lacunae TaxID=477680 RepID=A0A173MNZ9_9BACT|nr:hypothetical protein FLA_5410 [Filimonas lacunae]SIS71760.1 Outer membrane protein beta-barrel domain-containing protein [Filimonas lacunae]
MKRAFLLLVIMAFAAAGVQAQQKQKEKIKRVYYGLKAGMNFSNISGEGIKSSLQQGVDFGAFAEVKLSKRFDFVPELYYSLHNLKRTDDFQTRYFEDGVALSSSDEKIKLHYLSVPLLFRFHATSVIAVDAGPQYNLLVYEDDNLLKDSKPSFKKSEFAVAGGITLTLDKFRIFGRYTYGVSNVLDIPTTKGYKWNSNQAQIGIALVIN